MTKTVVPLITITRERQSDHSEREVGWRGDPRFRTRSEEEMRNFYSKYAAAAKQGMMTGALAPVIFLLFPVQQSHTLRAAGFVPHHPARSAGAESWYQIIKADGNRLL